MSRFGRLTITVTCSALVSSCAALQDSSPGDIIETPPDFQPSYTSSWSAETGIDLFSRGAELVRASLEAGWQTSMYTFKDSFPGYREAIDYPHNTNRDITWGVQTENTANDRVGEFTTNYHITEISESPTEVTASICKDIVNTEPVAFDSPTRHGYSWTVALRNTSDTPGLPGIVDTDPDNHDPHARRTPNWDVFDTWKITRLTPDSLDTEQNIADPACTTWWLANHPDTLRVVDNFTFRPPGVVPGTPLAPQYPEWIGPSDTQ